MPGNGEKALLLRQLTAAVAAAQDGVDAFDEAAAVRLGVNRTDLRCLSVLGRSGAMPASELAARAGLSRPATTTAIDRLAAARYVRRVHDTVDRRRVLIELTARARRAEREIWGPLSEEGLAKASQYSVEELRTILDFLGADRELQKRHVKRLRARMEGRARGKPTSESGRPGMDGSGGA
jgi:DNA-binding MarR family transcriptional regulator